MKTRTDRITVDDQGRLVLSPTLMQHMGYTPGMVIQVEEHGNRLSLVRSTESLRRVYLEPTNACNLDCRTCMRHVWDEPLGQMSFQIFEQVLQGIQDFSPRPTLVFGGFGEPLAHPGILHMISGAKDAGLEVELITNGTLLTGAAAAHLVETGLDRLWVSIDGATPESYADIRLGDALPLVVSNLSRLQELRRRSERLLPRLGIAFVAMQRNLADLPAVVRLGQRLGADRFSVSNVLAHTAELNEQVLYARSMSDCHLQPSPWSPAVELPRLDLNEKTLETLAALFKGRSLGQVLGESPGGMPGLGVNTCPFIEKGSLSIRWDGAVSPCLPLLHTHESYLGETRRLTHAFAVGCLQERSLAGLWNDPAYVSLRQRLQAFDYSPCTLCNSCEMAGANLEDCFGSPHPACGGCLWAQGFIRCP
jgi:MoaA/NifB/PqqE/SkfB family radical SAM enzyme